VDSGLDFQQALQRFGPELLAALRAFEIVGRRLHPPRIGELREGLLPFRDDLARSLAELRVASAPAQLAGLAAELIRSGELVYGALRDFTADVSPQAAIASVLRAMHAHCHAQATLYPLRKILPPISLYFLEPAFHARLAELDPDPPAELPIGVFDVRNPSGARGGFWLYVPESYDGTRPWPLVVALHGGSGTGAEFLWTWLREARGRQFLLMAPTSTASTWSLGEDDLDAPALHSMVEYVRARWRVDTDRILLTGLSDGATYTLLCGLRADMPFTALAPISGVLHPINLVNGNLSRARGKRIYMVHGALDWMFPIALARMAHQELENAGADITFRAIADLSHTYPREENPNILAWFDPQLAR
jgi:phospholipase/carboxylesterase